MTGTVDRAQTANSKNIRNYNIKIADSITFQIAKYRNVWIVPDMPKARSGKIRCRVLGAISNKGDVGNVMTLAKPEVVAQIQKTVG